VIRGGRSGQWVRAQLLLLLLLLTLANDGQTLRVRFAAGSQLRVGAQRYRLRQLHLHTPGGDRIGK
jgi:carbonic anhydrase